MEIQLTFQAVSFAIIKLFILMSCGYFLYFKRMIDDKFVDTLSLLLITVFFPTLIISKTISYFDFSEYAYWWVLPFCGIFFSLGGMILGIIFHAGFRKGKPSREFIVSCGFQNSGYLPMNLILFSFAGLISERLLIYMFLFIIGFNLLMWSVVPLFLSRKLLKEFSLRKLLNPPVVATVFSLIWVFILGKGSMPHLVMDPLKQLGQISFPVAMITLGAYLAKYGIYNTKDRSLLFLNILVKLFVFPFIMMFLLLNISMDASLRFLLFLECIMPTAVSLVVIGSYSGSNNEFLSNSVFYTHIVSIVSIPIWLFVFYRLAG